MPEGVVEHIAGAFPVDLAVLGREAVTSFARAAVDATRELGASDSDDVLDLVDLMLLLGSQFHCDPLHPWASEILADASIAPGGRARALWERGMVALDAVNGPTGTHALRAALRIRRLGFDAIAATPASDADVIAMAEHLHPTRAAALRDATAWPAVLSLADERRAAAGLGHASARAPWTALVLLSGSRFDADPLHPWAASALRSTATGDARARALFDARYAALDVALRCMPPQEAS